MIDYHLKKGSESFETEPLCSEMRKREQSNKTENCTPPSSLPTGQLFSQSDPFPSYLHCLFPLEPSHSLVLKFFLYSRPFLIIVFSVELSLLVCIALQ